MNEIQYKRYNNSKNKVIRKILNLLEYKYGYERIELILITKELEHKPLNYLKYYYIKLIQNI